MIVLGTVVLPVLGLEWWQDSKAKAMDPTLFRADLDRFQVVKLFTPWCTYCRETHHIYDQLTTEHPELDFYMLNCDPHRQFCMTFRFNVFPYILLRAPNKTVLFTTQGKFSKKSLEQAIAKFVKPQQQAGGTQHQEKQPKLEQQQQNISPDTQQQQPNELKDQNQPNNKKQGAQPQKKEQSCQKKGLDELQRLKSKVKLLEDKKQMMMAKLKSLEKELIRRGQLQEKLAQAKSQESSQWALLENDAAESAAEGWRTRYLILAAPALALGLSLLLNRRRGRGRYSRLPV